MPDVQKEICVLCQYDGYYLEVLSMQVGLCVPDVVEVHSKLQERGIVMTGPMAGPFTFAEAKTLLGIVGSIVSSLLHISSYQKLKILAAEKPDGLSNKLYIHLRNILCLYLMKGMESAVKDQVLYDVFSEHVTLLAAIELFKRFHYDGRLQNFTESFLPKLQKQLKQQLDRLERLEQVRNS